MSSFYYTLFGGMSSKKFQFNGLEKKIIDDINAYAGNHQSMPNTLKVQIPRTLHASEEPFIVSAIANGLFKIYNDFRQTKRRPVQRINRVYISITLSEKEPKGPWLNNIKLFPSFIMQTNEKDGTQVIAVSKDRIDVDQAPNIPDGVSIFWIDKFNFWVLLPAEQTEVQRPRRSLILDKDCDIKLEGGRNAVDLYEGTTWLGGRNGNSSMPDAHYIRFSTDEIPVDAAKIEIKDKSILISPGCCSPIIVDGSPINHETLISPCSDITVCGATFIIK